MEKQHQKLYRNLILTCIIGVITSSALAQSRNTKLQKAGLMGLATSLMAGVGVSAALPRDDEDNDPRMKNVEEEIRHKRPQQRQ